MTDDERELVEMMESEALKQGYSVDCSVMQSVLSVVKANLSKIAEVCPMCNGQGLYEQHTGDNEREQRECECQNGIVPKGK